MTPTHPATPLRRRRSLLACGALAAFAALAGAAPALAQASVQGQWSGVVDWPAIPVHATLLPDGKVLTFGATPNGNQGGFDFDVWDPALGTGANAHVTQPNIVSMDSFCASQILQPWSGEIMIAGGATTTPADTFKSQRFSWKRKTMAAIEGLAFPRWYSTMTTLPDGRVLINGGTVPYGDWTNAATTAEIYTPGQGWRALAGTAQRNEATGGLERRYWYPRTWPIAGDKVFVLSGKAMYTLGYEGEGSIGGFQRFDRPNWGGTSSAVMFAPKKILQFGGGAGGNDDGGDSGAHAATMIDLAAAPFAATEVGGLRQGRYWPTATVLPNGEVLATGGSLGNNTLNTPALAAEIWNPASGQWRTGASMAVARLYHSVALLLPDGRVLSGGGGAPGPVYGKNAEIFSPPYLFNADGSPVSRPVVATEPGIVRLGQTFEVKASAGARPIARFTLVKTGAVTHGYNLDQRFLELPFTQAGETFRLTMTGDAIDATPGYYMLFALDTAGTPSIARMLRVPSPIADNGEAPPASGGTAPAPDGGDPAQLVWTTCAREGEVCAIPNRELGSAPVRYGANGVWSAARSATAAIACSNDVFGDPVPGTVKSCQYGRPRATTPGNPTPEVADLPPAGPSTLLAGHSRLCLSVKGNSLADGADLVQEACRAGDAGQGWTWRAANGGYAIVNARSNKCLDIFNGGAADGTRLVQWTCWDGPMQIWQPRRTAAGTAIVSTLTGKCVDVAGISPAAGAAVHQWTCLGAANQAWTAGAIGTAPTPTPPTPPVPPRVAIGPTPLVAGHSGLCLAVSGNSSRNGAAIEQAACRNRAAQTWTLRPEGTGYAVVNAGSGKCLDVSNGSMGEGAAIVQRDCSGNAGQVFTLRATARGTAIVAQHSSKCVDVSGLSRASGARIWQWSCNGAANQGWWTGNGRAVPTN